MLHRQLLRGSRTLCITCQSHRALRVHCAFNFAESSRVQQPQVGRRNRAVEKRKEQELRTIVHGLCAFSNKQLQAVSHLLSEEHIKQIKIAMDIPPTNQGRRRQEALVLKLLRDELDSLALDKLSDAVRMAERNNLSYSDSDVEQQLQLWIEGLIENDEEVIEEVYSLVQDRNLDWQQLRTWVRQVQQQQLSLQQQQAQEQQQQHGNSWPSEAGPDPQEPAAEGAVDLEVQQLMQELAVQQGKAAGRKGKSAFAAARRALRNMLKPIAVDMHAVK